MSKKGSRRGRVTGTTQTKSYVYLRAYRGFRGGRILLKISSNNLYEKQTTISYDEATTSTPNKVGPQKEIVWSYTYGRYRSTSGGVKRKLRSIDFKRIQCGWICWNHWIWSKPLGELSQSIEWWFVTYFLGNKVEILFKMVKIQKLILGPHVISQDTSCSLFNGDYR